MISEFSFLLPSLPANTYHLLSVWQFLRHQKDTGTENRHSPCPHGASSQGEPMFVALKLTVPMSSLCYEESLPTRFVAEL